ncbi:Ribosome association toxin PasT (RatA) of the RatAB toxin-antitoxin module [Streptomyces sp. 1222.5]|uniref:type II toxin-antitoxin system RatA family toxin n=1 Tax=unclassified Streptomyces TaxID=2593676 RepID=UPI00089B9159|nr:MULTISPECIES: SRPBCC family protein [unclassified Streptomyces]PKW11914.1 ribosome-associated toxin RatA of RatAB toxin-antitoxin module [Streptomyces sp. 5112.2]SEB66967.1 Ribosome association toxin PasT (RatA) of the RatAB toxin-antitoxin module [Streptomyces sp. 1222.5]
MRSVRLDFQAHGVAAADAYARIRDFARYPDLVDTVRKVTVHPTLDDGSLHSDWEVDFRNGVLAWSEEDVFDDGALSISFRQLHGDFEAFDGAWSVEGSGDGARVAFTAGFDFGLPTLANIVDPVAERVLRETIEHILRALLGAGEVL